MVDQKSASSAYDLHRISILEMCKAIEESLTKKDSSEVDWGDVGDLARIRDKLDEVILLV